MNIVKNGVWRSLFTDEFYFINFDTEVITQLSLAGGSLVSERSLLLPAIYWDTTPSLLKRNMSENGDGQGDRESSSSSKKSASPSKPPRPPPPSNCSKLSQPSSIQQHLDALQPLKPDRVRWFVKEDKKWVPFSGCDSLAIEQCYRQILALESRIEDSCKPLNTSKMYEMPTVKGNLYEVDVVARECTPIYWKGMCKLYAWGRGLRLSGFRKDSRKIAYLVEGLPGVLGNKGTLAKYRREQGNISQFLGTGNKISKNYSTKTFWESVGTWEHSAILEGKKGTRTPPGRPSLFRTETEVQKPYPVQQHIPVCELFEGVPPPRITSLIN